MTEERLSPEGRPSRVPSFRASRIGSSSAGDHRSPRPVSHGVLKADPTFGTIDRAWDPHLIPDSRNYTGGWVEEVVNGSLWLGGNFGKIDGDKHHGIAPWTL
jgi:hypothetical protein